MANASVSIIVPIEGSDDSRIEQCFESVLNQSLREIELICVIDEGPVPAIVEDMVAKDPRVSLVRHEAGGNKTKYAAGLESAQGLYVHFLRCEDYVLDYAYEALLQKATKHDLDYLRFCGIAYDRDRETAVSDRECDLDGLRDGDFNRPMTAQTDAMTLKLRGSIWTALYRRTFLVDSGVCNKAITAKDRAFFDMVMASAGRVMAARDRLVVHSVAEESPSKPEVRQAIADQMDVVERIDASYPGGKDDGLFERIFKSEIDELIRLTSILLVDDSDTMQTTIDVEAFVYRFNYPYLRSARTSISGKLRDLQVKLKKLEEAKEKGTYEEVAASMGPTLPTRKPKYVFFERYEKPKVSVVVPIYNQEDFLNEALNSLTTQTLQEIEFLCVNDGSNDASMLIMKEYAAIDKRFIILDKENTGYGNSMNVGIDAARGEYLGILEPDDFVPADMFKRLYTVAANNDLDLVKADFYRFWISEDGATKKRLFRLTSDASYYNRVVDTSEETEAFNFVMNTWSGIYKMEFLNRWSIRHNETPGASYQDNGFWFQTFCRAKRAWFVRTPFYMNRRDNPNSSMFNKGKFYAVTREYEFIWKWLSKDPQLVEKYESIFYRKKLSNFFVTYKRLAREHKQDYLHHLKDEFEPLVRAGKLTSDMVGPAWWKMLNDIFEDPDAFASKIRVSVIIPAYNAEDDIRKCLDSILTRDEVASEFIVVDDGSTDSTLSILREYEQKDARVKVVTQENGGAGAARNNGMKYATGEYLLFLDADDFFELDMISRLWSKAYTDDADIVVCRSDNYDQQTGVYSAMRYTIRDDLLPLDRPFAGTDLQNDAFKAFVGWPWDKLFKAEYVRRNGLLFQEQRTTNDLLFVFSAIAKAQRISIVGSVLAHHQRKQSGKTLSVSRELSWDCFYKALLALREQLVEWGMYDRFERDFVNYSLHACLWNLHTLRGASYYKLYEKLTTEWFDNLGILGKDDLYFYDGGEYASLCRIEALSADEYLFERLDNATQEAALQRKRGDNLASQLNTAKKNLRAAKRAKATAVKQKEATMSELEKVKASNSMKIGHALTWLPRKIKEL